MNTRTIQILTRIQKEYIKRLQTKNGWGKDQAANLYVQTVADVSLELLAEAEAEVKL